MCLVSSSHTSLFVSVVASPPSSVTAAHQSVRNMRGAGKICLNNCYKFNNNKFIKVTGDQTVGRMSQPVSMIFRFSFLIFIERTAAFTGLCEQTLSILDLYLFIFLFSFRFAEKNSTKFRCMRCLLTFVAVGFSFSVSTYYFASTNNHTESSDSLQQT